MPKHKGKKSGLHGLQAQCAELARGAREAFDGLVDSVSDELDELEQYIGQDSAFDDFRHNAEKLFARGKHKVQDFMCGTEVDPAETALRQAQEGMKDLQHEAGAIAGKLGKELGHLGKDIQHKAQEIWQKVQDWFSKIVEKIGHFMKEVKQHGISAIFGSPGEKHVAHHHEPAPDSSHPHRPKPKRE